MKKILYYKLAISLLAITGLAVIAFGEYSIQQYITWHCRYYGVMLGEDFYDASATLYFRIATLVMLLNILFVWLNRKNLTIINLYLSLAFLLYSIFYRIKYSPRNVSFDNVGCILLCFVIPVAIIILCSHLYEKQKKNK